MGIRLTNLLLSVIVASAVASLATATVKSRAEQAINTLTMRHVNHVALAVPPEAVPTALLIAHVARAAEKPKEAPRALPVRKKAVPVQEPSTQSLATLRARWGAVMDELGTVHKTKLLNMIDCESDFREKIVVWDVHSNSYGMLQFKMPTWDRFSKRAGVKGSPLVGRDAIRVADWAVSNGYGSHWSCY